MEDTRRDEPPLLDSLLSSLSAATRASAALTAGRLGGLVHRDRLRALETESTTQVAANALFALALLKDSLSVPLAEQALAREPRVAVQGAWLLGELGEHGRATIIRALAAPALGADARGALLLAAARLRPVPTAAIAPWVASPDSAIAWRAAYALARGRSAAGVRALLGGASSRFAAVREQAARGLGRAAAGDSLGEQAIRALNALLPDADAHVRVNTVRSLASYGRRSAAAVQGALHDVDPGVRLTAAQSLENVLDSAAYGWTSALTTDTSFVMQRAVAEGAVRRGIVPDVLGAWRHSSDWRHRAAAAELDAIGAARLALPRAEGWTHDADGRVRAAATGEIARLADSAVTRGRARNGLRVQLRDEDVGVRTAALGGLASGAGDDDLARALDTYERSRTDRDADARLAFWQLADSALRGSRLLPDSVERRLVALARPSDPLERAAAARVPRFSTWRDETGEPRTLDWYEARAREALQPGEPHAVIQLEYGTIDLTLLRSDAPLTVYNFVELARAGYFDGQRFHRVVPNFVAQAGDPRGDGNGGPGYAIRDEINPRRYVRGTLGMALSGPNTGGSQFFITHSPQPHLDGGYTVFGQLHAGGETLDRIVQGDRIVRITIR